MSPDAFKGCGETDAAPDVDLTNENTSDDPEISMSTQPSSPVVNPEILSQFNELETICSEEKKRFADKRLDIEVSRENVCENFLQAFKKADNFSK